MESASVQSVDTVRAAYSARAQEYIDLFGSMTSVHPSDQALVSAWAGTLTGPVLDAGCGPGQWSGFLAERGLAVRGIDKVPDFIERARGELPDIAFELGGFEKLGVATGSLGGVLAWYSLIHYSPQEIRVPLAEFARVIGSGGGLLVGFFDGESIESFDHAVTTAYRWPVADLDQELVTAGFEVAETHRRTGSGYRPHGAIIARRL
ncbi:class I SAM-dependent methyltransferase [Aldersonia kunmingensis]|uniref:class I SAM-dependent methyltransferase n=1 Tax=Aldersonia kunmingensis TaxID=408066 RepID=UPI000AFACF2D|nr:methyltransferase domain-containing protein [Aldersonia kunmingensis]